MGGFKAEDFKALARGPEDRAAHQLLDGLEIEGRMLPSAAPWAMSSPNPAAATYLGLSAEQVDATIEWLKEEPGCPCGQCTAR